MARLRMNVQVCVWQADVILGNSPGKGWEWEAKGLDGFTRMCFYTGNLNCWFSIRYLENQKRGTGGQRKGGKRRETDSWKDSVCLMDGGLFTFWRQIDWWSVVTLVNESFMNLISFASWHIYHCIHFLSQTHWKSHMLNEWCVKELISKRAYLPIGQLGVLGSGAAVITFEFVLSVFEEGIQAFL